MVSFDDISNKPVKFTVFGSTSVMADGYNFPFYYTTPPDITMSHPLMYMY